MFEITDCKVGDHKFLQFLRCFFVCFQINGSMCTRRSNPILQS